MSLQAREPNSNSQFNFSTFQRMAPFIRQVRQSFPHEVIYYPQDISATSFALYFRSACAAYIHPDCNWTFECTKEEIFSMFENGLQFEVNKEQKKVRAYCKSFNTSVKQVPVTLTSTTLNVQHSPEILRALLVLKNADIISHPLELSSVPGSFHSLLNEFPNVSCSEKHGVITVF